MAELRSCGPGDDDDAGVVCVGCGCVEGAEIFELHSQVYVLHKCRSVMRRAAHSTNPESGMPAARVPQLAIAAMTSKAFSGVWHIVGWCRVVDASAMGDPMRCGESSLRQLATKTLY